jgi:hypothetical protein
MTELHCDRVLAQLVQLGPDMLNYTARPMPEGCNPPVDVTMSL